MKKAISLLLSLLMVFGLFGAAVQAQAKEPVKPAIIVTGFAMTMLYDNAESEDREQVWYFPLTDMLKATVEDAENLPRAITEALQGDPTYMGQRIADGGKRMLPSMFCNPNGTSVSSVTNYPNDPAITNYEYLYNPNGNFYDDLKDPLYEPQLCERLSENIGRENVFIFQYDFRMSALDCAEDLRNYIKDVLEYTGAKQVDLFGMSFGGMITGTYLSLYGSDKAVDNCVLDVPALRGANFATDFMRGKIDLPAENLIGYAERALELETGISHCFSDAQIDKINTLMSAFLIEISNMPQYWGSLWDLLPVEDYEKLKAELLDKTDNAEIIRKSDIMHYEIMPNYRNAFLKCMANGMKISILCSTGSTTCFGGNENADMMLEASRVSGSTCALLGERFADGYFGCGNNCGNKGHNHVSPSMEIDATTAYLPDNTWFIEGQYHGMYFAEEHTLNLVEKLMTADEAINVYSDPEYPQFDISSHCYFGIYAKFDSSSTGFIDGKDTALVITNLSKKYPIVVSSIVCDGVDIAFDAESIGSIKPGQSATVSFTGELPQVSKKAASITVNFVRVGAANCINTRTFDFTVNNGVAVDYAGGFVSSDTNQAEANFFEKISIFFKALLAAFTGMFNFNK